MARRPVTASNRAVSLPSLQHVSSVAPQLRAAFSRVQAVKRLDGDAREAAVADLLAAAPRVEGRTLPVALVTCVLDLPQAELDGLETALEAAAATAEAASNTPSPQNT